MIGQRVQVEGVVKRSSNGIQKDLKLIVKFMGLQAVKPIVLTVPNEFGVITPKPKA
jgi:hypothetical protein